MLYDLPFIVIGTLTMKPRRWVSVLRHLCYCHIILYEYYIWYI